MREAGVWRFLLANARKIVSTNHQAIVWQDLDVVERQQLVSLAAELLSLVNINNCRVLPAPARVSGMRNRESNCYLAAFLQCLAATPSIMPCFRRGNLPPNCLTAVIQHSLFDLVVARDRSLDPTPLLDRICRLSGAEKAKFTRGLQHDPSEMMVLLAADMNAERRSMGVPSIFEACTFYMGSKVVCPNCSTSRMLDAFPYQLLTLAIDGNPTLLGALEALLAPAILDEPPSCHNCQGEPASDSAHASEQPFWTTKTTISPAPAALAITLIRFDKTVKNESYVAFPKTFASTHVYQPKFLDVEKSYHLRGVLVHEGWSKDSGQYTAYVNRADAWYHANDDRVSKVLWREVKEAQAYMLVYELRVDSQTPAVAVCDPDAPIDQLQVMDAHNTTSSLKDNQVNLALPPPRPLLSLEDNQINIALPPPRPLLSPQPEDATSPANCGSAQEAPRLTRSLSRPPHPSSPCTDGGSPQAPHAAHGDEIDETLEPANATPVAHAVEMSEMLEPALAARVMHAEAVCEMYERRWFCPSVPPAASPSAPVSRRRRLIGGMKKAFARLGARFG